MLLIIMKLTSSTFSNTTPIPAKYTCDGDDTSPPLYIEDVPHGAKSLALIADDPDAQGGAWVHWTLWGIPPETKKIGANLPPGATQGTTSFGKTEYGGPCPPHGEHRYFFKLYALDTILDLPPAADKETLEEAMTGHVLEHAELMGTYARSKV